VWIEAAWKCGGGAFPVKAKRRFLRFRSRRDNYAVGGALEARCRENELLGAGRWGSEENRAISSGAAISSRAAAASTGKCSD